MGIFCPATGHTTTKYRLREVNHGQLTDKLSDQQATLDDRWGWPAATTCLPGSVDRQPPGRLYVIDGYGDDGVIERICSFLLGRGAQLAENAADMQDFIDRCITFCEVDCENKVDNILTGAFLGKVYCW